MNEMHLSRPEKTDGHHLHCTAQREGEEKRDRRAGPGSRGGGRAASNEGIHGR